MWLPVLPLLAKHYQVISFDRRGFGQSPCDPDFDLELSDIDALLTHLQTQKGVLVGMSQGGRIALRYAVTRPERLAALVLQGMQLDGFEAQGSAAEHIPLDRYVELMEQNRRDEVERLWLSHPLTKIPPGAASIAQLLRAMTATYPAKDLNHAVLAKMKSGIKVAERLSLVTCPTLVVEGESEIPALKKVADKLLADIPNVRRMTLGGGGHLISLLEPHQFSEALLNFLSDVEASA
jgi:pimeloyl-ACP methyl ester carboxylesterase